MTEEYEKHFKEISKKPFSYLPKYVAPHLVGPEWYWIRRALLMMLVTQSNAKTRIRLHMLLVGPPGTGKTEFMLWYRKHMHGMLINAELATKVGLVGDARGNKITPGLLADCDGSIVLVDELDKMSPKDQNGLLQAMEEGSYMIIKGKNRERFNAEVRIVASTNSLEKIQRPLLDRFDFIFHVGTTTRQERARNVSKLVDSFLDSKEKDYTTTIIKFFNWINDYDTKIAFEDKKAIDRLIENYILHTETNIKYVSYRSLELSILRIAYAMARLERRNITVAHVNYAIWLKDQILHSLAK